MKMEKNRWMKVCFFYMMGIIFAVLFFLGQDFDLVEWELSLIENKVKAPVYIEKKIFQPVKINFDLVFKHKKESLDVPDLDTSFHAFMSAWAINNKTSAQYAFRDKCSINKKGLMVYHNPETQEYEYVMAIGQYYSKKVGERFEIEFDNGRKHKFVVGDVKQNAHTDPTNRYRPVSGEKVNVVEFIVNTRSKLGPTISPKVRKMGTLSVLPEFNGRVVAIRRLEDSPWLENRKN